MVKDSLAFLSVDLTLVEFIILAILYITDFRIIFMGINMETPIMNLDAPNNIHAATFVEMIGFGAPLYGLGNGT